MRYLNNEISIKIITFIIFIIIVFGGALLIEKERCTVRWQVSGKQAYFEILSGCMVETSPGIYIPEKRIFVVEKGSN